MKKQHILLTGVAVSAIIASTVFAQTPLPESVPAQKQCSDMTGAAYDLCVKSAPARSGDSASSPGANDAASRTAPAAIVKDPSMRGNRQIDGGPGVNPKN